MVEPTESKGTPEAFGQGKTLPLLAAYAHSFSTALSSALDETFSLPDKGIGSPINCTLLLVLRFLAFVSLLDEYLMARATRMMR